MLPMTHNRHRLIVDFHIKGLKLRQIQRRLQNLGISMSLNGIAHHVKKYEVGAKRKAERKLKIDQTHIQMIKEELLRKPFQTTTGILNFLRAKGIIVSKATAHRIVRKAGLTTATPRYCQMIRDVNKVKRVAFCQSLIQTNDELRDVIFTDESSIQLHHNKLWCYRLEGAPPPMCPKPKHPLKVHVWGGISRKGKTRLLIFDGIMKADFFKEEILKNTLLPFIQKKYPLGHRLQQDNDPKHKSKLARQYMLESGINWWEWPSESCDLNPIEMVWAQMKRFISNVRPLTKQDLIDAINDFWNNHLSKKLCNSYINHIYKVAPICLKMEGRATGDIPNRIFRQSSKKKSFQYFHEKLQHPELEEKIKRLINKNTN